MILCAKFSLIGLVVLEKKPKTVKQTNARQNEKASYFFLGIFGIKFNLCLFNIKIMLTVDRNLEQSHTSIYKGIKPVCVK